MKNKILVIVMHLIAIIACIATIGSFVCFLVFKKTTATVSQIDAYPEDTVVHLSFVVDNETYERKQNYSGTSNIRYGDRRPIWYYSKDPELNVMVRDFAAYYYLAGFFGLAEIAYFFGKRARKARGDKADHYQISKDK